MLARVQRRIFLAAFAGATLTAGARAHDFTVTDQTQFDAAVSVATQPGRNDTINVDALSISSGPALMLPAAAAGITINFNGVSGTSGDNPTFNVGFGSSGQLSIADGTTLNFNTGNGVSRFNVGRFASANDGTGTVNMSGGTINGGPTGSGRYFALDVGRGSTGTVGTFNQSGGQVNMSSGAFQIGVVGATGTYTMTNDAVVAFDPGGTIYLGESATGDGTLNIHDNAQFTTGSGDAYIGHNGGTGTVNQDGDGSRVVLGTQTRLGGGGASGSTGGTGTYNISAGSLEINGLLFMGFHAQSVAVLNQTGGIVTLNNQLRFGAGAGTYNLDGGVLQINAANPFATGAGTSEFNLGGGMIQSLTSFTSVATLDFTLLDGTTSTIDTTDGTTATFNGAFTGDGALYKIGTGTLVLNGANTFAGGTVIDGGTTIVGSNTAFGTGDVLFAGSSTVQFGGSYTLANPMLIGANVLATFDTNAFDGTLDGIIVGDGALVKDGDGTLILDAANTYTGGTKVAAGTLQLGANGSLGSVGGLEVDAGATFDLNDNDQEVGFLSGEGTVEVGLGEFIVGGSNLNSAFSGTINMTGQAYDNPNGVFAKVGTGTLVIDGVTISQGETHVREGKLAQTDGDSSISYLAVGTGAGNVGALDVSGGTLTIGIGLQVGDWGGTGTVNQTGGAVIVDPECGSAANCAAFNLGNQGGTGTYNISGGMLELNGGLHSIGRSEGTNPASHGALNISGDALVVLHPSSLYDGSLVIGSRSSTSHADGQGTGEINQTGGTLRIANDSALFLSGYGEGVYNLYGGVLEIGSNSLRGNYAGGAAYDFNIGNAEIKVIGAALVTSVDATLLDGALASIDTNGFGATWSGVLSGTGALRKLGDGTLVLNAANTYGGGTWIAGGTVQLGASGSLASTGAVHLDADGTFDLNGQTQTIGAFSGAGDVLLGSGNLVTDTGLSTAYSGSMSGTGGFEKAGAGTFVMSGISSYTGDTVVSGGELVLDGTLASKVIVEDGARLSGVGTKGALYLGPGATIAPGHSPGTLTVTNDAEFALGSTYEVDIEADGTSDLIDVGGTATIHGGRVSILAAPGAYSPLLVYTILTAGTLVDGEFDEVSSNLAFLKPLLDYDTNNVFLRFERNAVELEDVAVTGNQRSVAGALDRMSISNPLLANVLSQTVGGAQQAFDALSGEVHASAASMMVLDSYYVRDSIFSRLRQSFYGGGSGAQQVAFANSGPMTVALADPASRMSLGMGPDVQRAGWEPVSTPQSHGLVFWTQGFGAWGGLGGNGNAAGIDRSLGGFVSGVDAGLGGGWRGGMATGYMHSSLSAGARSSSAAIDSFILAAYAGGPAGDFALRTGGAWSWQWLDTKRNVVFPGFFEVERADYTAGTGQLFAEIAYPLLHGGAAWEPFAALSYIHAGTGSFSEGAGEAALSSRGADQNVGISLLGVRAATSLPWRRMLLTPYGSLAWQYAFGDITPTQAFAFNSADVGFGIAGVPLAQSSAVIEAGVDLAIAPGATVGVGYIGQLADDLHDNSVQGRFNWQF
jgi:outer membrane autotransporter protein